MKNRLIIALLAGLWGCREKQLPRDTLFQSIDGPAAGIVFTNAVQDDAELNIFNYRNFYNGGGVALGDVNNDGLTDVFLTANQGENRLFLNRGNWKFEDVSEKAGIRGKRGWSTGVTFADLNGDGWLDIYVCNSGNRKNDDRANECFISNGGRPGSIPTYTDRAAELGLDDRGFSTHAAFFDYDLDGDLDMYLLNNSFTPIGRLGYKNLRAERDPAGGDKLFRNDGSRFADVSEQAGIYGSLIGFGLGITIGDVNNDNWPDIYISNDFYERDYLYINQKNGTFQERLTQEMNHISLSSMGADIADMNNDGLLDIFVTDMLPFDDRRLKTTSTYENYDLYQFKLTQDYHHQLMRNMLHRNNGDGTFSEVGQLSGVQATDWSWGALLFDMDSDGRKDVFVANGIARDLTDQDFITYFSDDATVQRIMGGQGFDYKQFIEKIKSKPIPNYAFRNEADWQFTNKAAEWGLDGPSFSNGAAYGDLDNDGDLDLIINNVNQPVGIFRNRSVEKNKSHFLRVKLEGSPQNRQGIGVTLTLYQQGHTQTLQQMPNRGFQSSVDHVLVFGLGTRPVIDSLEIRWPDDRRQSLRSPQSNTTLTLRASEAVFSKSKKSIDVQPLVVDITEKSGLQFLQEENDFVDYNRDVLLKQMLSREGPALAVGDVNGDGLSDVYLGGAAGKPRSLFLQKPGEKFVKGDFYVADRDLAAEDVAAVFFDADGDKDLDLYVATGGNEFLPGAYELEDRLYINDGHGHFTRDARLPAIQENNSCVVAADVDADGDQDLFVGSRMVSGAYGLTPPHTLLLNDGTGQFKAQTRQLMPEIARLGMVTDALWLDADRDGRPDLLTAEDWGPITLWKNKNGLLTPTVLTGNGWWNRLTASDVDGDGDLDVLAGNRGLNHRIPASPQQPAELVVKDFDQNGTFEQIISCATENGKIYPMVLKTDLQRAVPSIKKKFIKFTDYAEKSLDEIFENSHNNATVRSVTESQSGVLLNNGPAGFVWQPLPRQAQLSPVYGMTATDLNADGRPDYLLTGNFLDVLPEIGPMDASFGLWLRRSPAGQWQVLPPAAGGLPIRGQVRRAAALNPQGTLLLLAKNGAAAQVLKIFPRKK